MKTERKFGRASARKVAMASAKPEVEALRDELAVVLEDAGTINGRQARADGVRFNQWDGQSDDNRKHGEAIGEEPAPFEGAADTRIPVADTIVTEQKAILAQSFWRANLQGSTQKVHAIDESTRQSRLLHWLKNVALMEDLVDEVELAAQYMLGDDPGLAVIKTWWDQEVCLELKALTLDEVVAQILQRMPGGYGEGAEIPPEILAQAVEEFAPTLTDSSERKRAREFLEQTWPGVTPQALQSALTQLRKEGRCELPVPYVKPGLPRVMALRYMEDVFFAGDTRSMDSANAYELEWLTEVELRSRTLAGEWREDFVEAVLEAGPEDDLIAPDQSAFRKYRGRDAVRDEVPFGLDSATELYPVWHGYVWAANEYGVPGLYHTVFSRLVPDLYGKHELVDYQHGKGLFTVLTRERLRRELAQSRGVPALASSSQYEIKVHRDCFTDHTQLATMPPVRVTQRRGGLEAVLGPMVEVPVRNADDVTWMNPPQFPAAAREMEEASRRDLDQLFGRLTGETSAGGQAIAQDMVSRWLGKWSAVGMKMLGLCEQFMEPQIIELITGVPTPERKPRELIQLRPNVALSFDVRDLDLEWSTKKLEMVGKVITWDTMGITDRAMLVKLGMRMVDPLLADVAVKDPGVVTQQEVEQEVDAIARMAVGIEQPTRGDENAQLRLQTLQGITQQSPVLAQRLQTPGDVFGDLVKARSAAFEHQLEQVENAQIGRTGYVPQMNG